MGIDNVSGVEQSADFTLLFAARVQWAVGSGQSAVLAPGQ